MATKKAATPRKSRGAAKDAEKTAKKAAKKATAKASDAATEKADEPAAQAPSVELIGLEQLAELIKLPVTQVRRMLRSGQIRGVKVDGEWRFNPKLVQQTLGRRARGR